MTETLIKIVAGSLNGPRHPGREPTFLDSVNELIFMPRGLCAMVVEFKDNVFGQQEGPLNPLAHKMGRAIFTSEKIDLNESAMSPNSRPSGNNLSLQIELPEARPLVFPDLECAAAGVTESTESTERTNRAERTGLGGREKHKLIKAAGGWIGDQYERRKLESEVRLLLLPHHLRLVIGC